MSVMAINVNTRNTRNKYDSNVDCGIVQCGDGPLLAPLSLFAQ